MKNLKDSAVFKKIKGYKLRILTLPTNHKKSKFFQNYIISSNSLINPISLNKRRIFLLIISIKIKKRNHKYPIGFKIQRLKKNFWAFNLLVRFVLVLPGSTTRTLKFVPAINFKYPIGHGKPNFLKLKKYL